MEQPLIPFTVLAEELAGNASSQDVVPAGQAPLRRDRLRAWLQQQSLGGITSEEIEAHFASMPMHYWERVTESDMVWSLETVRRFLRGVAQLDSPGITPSLDWRHLPGGDGTRVMICTWDRRGLLAQAAACFSAVRLSIQQAAVFTRADHIALDVFRVRDADNHGCATPAKLDQMSFLLEGALSEPPRFASLWACSRHKYLALPPRVAPRIAWDNESSPSCTLLCIEAYDRLGLLYDVLQCLAGASLNIIQAEIDTDGEMARDVLHVVDDHGRKLFEPARRQELQRALETAITAAE